MDTDQILKRLQLISKAELYQKLMPAPLAIPENRVNILYEFIHGKIHLPYPFSWDLAEFALKALDRETFNSLPPRTHAYADNEDYEYDPPKNGQNILKHGLGFGEVVSYSQKFGTLTVPFPDHTDSERVAIFSDLILARDIDKLELPLQKTKKVNYVVTFATQRNNGRFRLFSSRLMSSKRKKYRNTLEQGLQNFPIEESKKEAFFDRCAEIIETHLIYRT